jgi:hypothetical protein
VFSNDDSLVFEEKNGWTGSKDDSSVFEWEDV